MKPNCALSAMTSQRPPSSPAPPCAPSKSAVCKARWRCSRHGLRWWAPRPRLNAGMRSKPSAGRARRWVYKPRSSAASARAWPTRACCSAWRWWPKGGPPRRASRSKQRAPLWRSTPHSTRATAACSTPRSARWPHHAESGERLRSWGVGRRPVLFHVQISIYPGAQRFFAVPNLRKKKLPCTHRVVPRAPYWRWPQC